MSDPDDHSNNRDMVDQDHEKDRLKEGVSASDLPPSSPSPSLHKALSEDLSSTKDWDNCNAPLASKNSFSLWLLASLFFK